MKYRKKTTPETKAPEDPPRQKRPYNSRSMVERRQRILKATLQLIEEDGVNGVTIRQISKKSDVALRTLYLYFGSREVIIGVAIKDFFYKNIEESGADPEPKTIASLLDRFDRLTDIIIGSKSYSSALAPIFFSANIDPGIYDILREIAISHVKSFVCELASSKANALSEGEKDLLIAQMANIEFAVINDALSGRIPLADLSACLKLAVLSLVAGFIPKPPADLKAAIQDLRQSLNRSEA
ncbi:TetR/AcrR family transcriptional regulator [Sphingosinicella microcystinivorans]|uniref:TetR/AcrR family transcriptional regulator n=1 Tax=Sphingosinicella microcystinivorans TaxID=335406 RepID=UPI0022F3B768|nr:TetR/AcrR family transcriptional regulator [Sphingosinicella microcystinivorans]WBX84416.1 TetR/AcrR family transcriptional regulator [Sphingosinicella microcystinivorans]